MKIPKPSSMTPPDTSARSATDKSSETRKAAEDFEAMAINEMLQPMFSAGQSDDGGFFGGGIGEKQFRPMLINEIAKSMEHAGGIGMVDAIYKQMLKMQDKP